MLAVQDYLVNIFIGNIMANYYQFLLYETKITIYIALSIKSVKTYRLSSSFSKTKQNETKTLKIFFSVLSVDIQT